MDNSGKLNEGFVESENGAIIIRKYSIWYFDEIRVDFQYYLLPYCFVQFTLHILLYAW